MAKKIPYSVVAFLDHVHAELDDWSKWHGKALDAEQVRAVYRAAFIQGASTARQLIERHGNIALIR